MFFIATDIEPCIGRSRPSDKGGRGGGAVTKKKFGGGRQASVWAKNTWGGGWVPRAPPPGSAPALKLILFEFLYTALLCPFCIPPLNQNGTLF